MEYLHQFLPLHIWNHPALLQPPQSDAGALKLSWSKCSAQDHTWIKSEVSQRLSQCLIFHMIISGKIHYTNCSFTNISNLFLSTQLIIHCPVTVCCITITNCCLTHVNMQHVYNTSLQCWYRLLHQIPPGQTWTHPSPPHTHRCGGCWGMPPRCSTHSCWGRTWRRIRMSCGSLTIFCFNMFLVLLSVRWVRLQRRKGHYAHVLQWHQVLAKKIKWQKLKKSKSHTDWTISLNDDF